MFTSLEKHCFSKPPDLIPDLCLLKFCIRLKKTTITPTLAFLRRIAVCGVDKKWIGHVLYIFSNGTTAFGRRLQISCVNHCVI
jgi:hypothetical protein